MKTKEPRTQYTAEIMTKASAYEQTVLPSQKAAASDNIISTSSEIMPSTNAVTIAEVVLLMRSAASKRI